VSGVEKLIDWEVVGRYPGRDRYRYVDPDGKLVGFSSYQQRPAAERNMPEGAGLVDIQSKEVLIEPDAAARVEALARSRDTHADKAKALTERIDAIQGAVRLL